MKSNIIFGLFAFVVVTFGLTVLSGQPVQATRNHEGGICNAHGGNGPAKASKGRFSGPRTSKECEEESKKPVIKAVVQCATVDGKMKISVTLTNSGDLEGSADVNGESIGLDPSESATVYLDSGSHVLVTFDYPTDDSDTVLYDQTLTCEPGRGDQIPETPVTPKTEIPVVLPHTSGVSTPIVTVGALSLASLILVAGTAIKSRLLA